MAAYALAVAALAAAVFAGLRAAAPGLAAGTVTVLHALDHALDEEIEDAAPARPSNFQRWLADREAAKQPRPAEPAKSHEPKPSPGPTGVAAMAKAKALAEMGRGQSGKSRRSGARGEAALPAGARPAQLPNYTLPPPADKHRVY